MNAPQPVPALTTVELSVDTLNRALGYLGSRPYVEVAGLINEIQGVVQQQMQARVTAAQALAAAGATGAEGAPQTNKEF